jgi:transcriptional regulator with XRE-family HTH domain
MAQSVADRIRALREQRGWSQQYLSRASGVSGRTIQRIEGGKLQPQPQTLQALASAFNVDVSKLRTGLTTEEIEAFERDFLCPTCGAELQERTFVEHEYGDTEMETFACGHVRGWRSRPCPKDPRFPKFEDYELRFHLDGDRWFCYATGKTQAAREVGLLQGAGETKEEAAKWVQRSYIQARDGYEAAHEFMPL